jgi:hypothetical protein
MRHVASVHAALQQRKICAEVTPEWQEVKPNHFVACHIYNDKYELEDNIASNGPLKGLWLCDVIVT